MELILKDQDKFYIKEGLASYDIYKATIFSSFEDLLTKVPLFRDWNIDYDVYQIVDNELVRINENIFRPIYLDLLHNHKLVHFNKIQQSFIRTTIK